MASQHRPILLAILPFLALTVVFGLLSNGVHHDDDLTHYLMARWSAWYPSYLLHIWGRPGLTVPLAAVSWIGDRETGWHAARLLSALVTAASALIAAQVARRLEIRPAWWVVVAFYLQPLAALLGVTTLTENFAALYLIAAVAILYAGRPIVASAVFSLILVTRHEAAVLAPLWWIALFTKPTTWPRRAAAVALSLWAPIVHNLLFFAVFQEWPLRIFFQANGSTQYTATTPWAYLPDALFAVTPAIAGLALIGVAAMLRRRRFLIPAVAIVFFLTQVVIKWLGVYASGGYGRFMVVMAPFIAILAVAGVNDLQSRQREQRRMTGPALLFAAVWLVGWIAFEAERLERHQNWSEPALGLLRGAVAAILVLLIAHQAMVRSGRGRWATRAFAIILLATSVIQSAFIVHPLRLRPQVELVQRTVAWLEQRGLVDSPFFATNPWFAYFLDLAENPRAHKDATLLASMPVGTIFVWDSTYSQSDFHRLDYWTFREDEHYELVQEIRWLGESEYKMAVFQKTAVTPIPTKKERYFPPVPEDRESVLGIYYIRAKHP